MFPKKNSYNQFINIGKTMSFFIIFFLGNSITIFAATFQKKSKHRQTPSIKIYKVINNQNRNLKLKALNKFEELGSIVWITMIRTIVAPKMLLRDHSSNV